jgi:hypothetical protein
VRGGFEGVCPKCEAMGPKRESRDEALRAWNGREFHFDEFIRLFVQVNDEHCFVASFVALQKMLRAQGRSYRLGIPDRDRNQSLPSHFHTAANL